MSLRCPECKQSLPAGREFLLLRRQSFNCPHCQCPTSLDQRGSSALKSVVLGGLGLGALLFAITRSPLLAFVVVGAGYIVGCIAARRVGTLSLFRKE
jgi:hypothetical protein